MSDAEVLRLVGEMEAYLNQDSAALDPGVIEAWHQRFLSAVSSAERGPEWGATADRARAVSMRIDKAVAVLSVQRDALRQEMEAQATGKRALKAYKQG